VGLFKDHLQFNFIPDGDTVLPSERDLRLELAGLFDGVDADGGDDEAAFLVEAQGVDVFNLSTCWKS